MIHHHLQTPPEPPSKTARQADPAQARGRDPVVPGEESRRPARERAGPRRGAPRLRRRAALGRARRAALLAGAGEPPEGGPHGLNGKSSTGLGLPTVLAEIASPGDRPLPRGGRRGDVDSPGGLLEGAGGRRARLALERARRRTGPAVTRRRSTTSASPAFPRSKTRRIYLEVLARLALAEDAAAQAAARDATLDRFRETERRYKAFRLESLDPDLREQVRGALRQAFRTGAGHGDSALAAALPARRRPGPGPANPDRRAARPRAGSPGADGDRRPLPSSCRRRRRRRRARPHPAAAAAHGASADS